MALDLPTEAAFMQVARDHNVVAMGTSINFDVETAISLADRFSEEEHFFLLESATTGPGGIARFSFLGFSPIWHFTSKENRTSHGFAGQAPVESREPRNPVRALEAAMADLSMGACGEAAQDYDGCDLTGMGGPVGYFSYDASVHMEPSVGVHPPGQLGLPIAHFFIPRYFLVLDQLRRRLALIHYAPILDKSKAACREAYLASCRALSELVQRVQTPHTPPPLVTRHGAADYEQCTASISKEDFLSTAEACLEDIRAGEIFQVQIGNRLSCPVEARPFDVFRHLRILNPSPYMVFYRFGEDHIICASPEMMVNVNGRSMLHRPIAGTRKRTWDSERDRERKVELQADEKERAEHVMLVDLSRNDLGRVAAPGSVQVDELMVVEEYSHVFHLVSQVSAELAEDENVFSAMESSFPNGTVSGAPKIRAMQIINSIEPCGREFYAGSLGIFDFSGNLKSTILIRTIHMRGGTASTQASAGIVYDSIPENEWQETRSKMAACLLAMQNTL